MSNIGRLVKKSLAETAVYWASSGKDRYNQNTYSSPVEIKCRWEQKTQVVKNSQGEEVVSEAQVFLMKNVNEQSLLLLGNLDDVSSAEEDDPHTIESGVYEVKSKAKIPGLGSKTVYLRIAYL